MILKIIKLKQEAKASFSITFEKPGNFNFYPGQYLDIELSTKERNKTRIFSISSSPSEEFVMITYKEGLSKYKMQLRELQPGNTIESSHPAGTVVIDDSAPIVMLAGGIGIAPHRSMIKWAVDRKLNLPITLIYSNSDDNFIFKKELDQWMKLYPKLTIYYVVTSKNGRLNEERIQKFLTSHLNNPTSHLPHLTSIHYLAGPPKMVDNFEEILLNLGVDSVNIRTDRFDGY